MDFDFDLILDSDLDLDRIWIVFGLDLDWIRIWIGFGLDLNADLDWIWNLDCSYISSFHKCYQQIFASLKPSNVFLVICS